MNIQQIQQGRQTTYNDLPLHWVTDWLLHVLDKSSSYLITDSDYLLSIEEQAKFEQGVAEMRSGKPLAYLIGCQAFWSLDFMVNEHTLIPRPDTEVLVEKVLDWIDSNANLRFSFNDKTKQLLDLGTGTGCIAISLAYELYKNRQKVGDWQVTGVDLSLGALAVAKQNKTNNKVNNVTFMHSSWYKQVTGKFHVIVSNPPYIDKADEHLAGLKCEPITALVADDKGLSDIQHIVEYAPKYLVKEGVLIIEHGYDQGESVRKIFSNHGFNTIETIKDYGGNDRVTMGVFVDF